MRLFGVIAAHEMKPQGALRTGTRSACSKTLLARRDAGTAPRLLGVVSRLFGGLLERLSSVNRGRMCCERCHRSNTSSNTLRLAGEYCSLHRRNSSVITCPSVNPDTHEKKCRVDAAPEDSQLNNKRSSVSFSCQILL